MKSIENDILDQVELEGLTAEQVDSMSNFEIKEFQRSESNDKINSQKKKVEFALVSALFFLLCASFLYANPILSAYISIAPLVVSIAFSIKAGVSHENLKLERASRSMLESFYEDNEL